MHRMISKIIVDSGKFLKMPVTSQALYFHLCVRADDDGIVEAYNVIKCCDYSEEALKQLEENGYVKILDNNLVTFILDWTTHNKIRPDRKIDSIYKDLLLSVLPDVVLVEKRTSNKIKMTKCGHLSDNGQTIDSKLTQEDKLSKDKISKDKLSEDKAKKKYGEFNHMLLTENEFKKLHSDFYNADELIKFLDEYIEMKGYKCKSCNLAIRKWVIDAVKEQAQRKNKNKEKEHSYDMAVLDKLAINMR